MRKRTTHSLCTLSACTTKASRRTPDVTSFIFTDFGVDSAEGEQGALLRARPEEVRRRMTQRLRLLRSALSGT